MVSVCVLLCVCVYVFGQLIFFVLSSTAALRVVYDKFGEESLKCGIPDGDGGEINHTVCYEPY